MNPARGPQFRNDETVLDPEARKEGARPTYCCRHLRLAVGSTPPRAVSSLNRVKIVDKRASASLSSWTALCGKPGCGLGCHRWLQRWKPGPLGQVMFVGFAKWLFCGIKVN
jgi:hypothetical protein